MQQKIINLISRYTEVPIDEIVADSDIISDLGLTSFDVAALVNDCEKEFGFAIPDRKIKYLATIGDVCEYLESQV